MRGFDEDERAAIREDLLDAGEKHFLRYGPEKTTVSDLTDEVGIAKGTFYRFFDSKSELFLEIFVGLRDDLVESVRSEVDSVEDGREGIRVLFTAYVDWLENHPVIQKVAADVDKGRFRRSLPQEELAAAEREKVERLVPVVERWQENGSIRDDVPASAIVGLVEPAALLVVSNDEYDEAYYRKRDFLIETIARGVSA